VECTGSSSTGVASLVSLACWVGSASAAVFLLLHAPLPVSCADLEALVYKGCANQSFPGGALPPTVAALSSALSAQAGSAKFYKTSSPSSAGSSTSVFGLFQCRGDLSGSDCASCVSRATSSWRDVCGASVAARVQLTGCLALYEVSGFPQVSGVQMLFKTCGTGSAGGGDFEVRRDTAFAALEGGVATSSGGFVATSYQALYAWRSARATSPRGTVASASPRPCSTSRSSAAAPPPRRRRSRNAFEERGDVFLHLSLRRQIASGCWL